MPTLQISDWPAIAETVFCLIVLVAIVIEHRRVSLLKREVQQLLQDVHGLAVAEQRRFMQELKSPKSAA
jgi:Tfp pilus assembly protein PilO